MSSEIKVDTISEKTSANGVTIDGVNLKDSVVKTDTINEKTSAAGVTIDGVLIKDNKLASGTGNVLQVVTAETTTATTVSGTTYTDTTLTASITPSATSSKILVLIAQEYNFSASVTTFIKAGIKVVRTIGATATDIKETSGLTLNSATGSAAQFGGILPITILDSPSTTSSVTYKTQQHQEQSDTSITTQSASEKSTITLIEIGG